MDCIFCKINDGSIPSFTIYENEVLRVFLDINPDTNGHLLIIPKKHYKDLMEIDNDTLVSIMNTAREMKKLLEEKLNIDGLTLIQNNDQNIVTHSQNMQAAQSQSTSAMENAQAQQDLQ